MMNLKHLMFGEAIALIKASADFPLPNPKKGALKTDFEAPFSSSLSLSLSLLPTFLKQVDVLSVC